VRIISTEAKPTQDWQATIALIYAPLARVVIQIMGGGIKQDGQDGQDKEKEKKQ
jgi:hypothetical protein